MVIFFQISVFFLNLKNLPAGRHTDSNLNKLGARTQGSADALIGQQGKEGGP